MIKKPNRKGGVIAKLNDIDNRLYDIEEKLTLIQTRILFMYEDHYKHKRPKEKVFDDYEKDYLERMRMN